MIRRCTTCGNYFDSRDGVCTVCGSNNLMPGERIAPKKTKKLVKVKKKTNWTPIVLFLVALFIVGWVVMSRAISPKFKLLDYVTVEGENIPKPTSILASNRMVFQSKKKTKNSESITLTYPNLDDIDIKNYASFLESKNFEKFAADKSVGYVIKSGKNKGKVLLVYFIPSNNGYSFNFVSVTGRVDQYSTGSGQNRVGNKDVGYINLSNKFSRLGKTNNPLVYKDVDDSCIIQMSLFRGPNTRNFNTYQNMVMNNLLPKERSNKIKNKSVIGISLGDYPGFMVYYFDNVENCHVREYHIYNEAGLEVRVLSFKTVYDDTKYLGLAYTYYLDYNNNDNKSISVNN